MENMSNETIRFFADQVIRQYHDLRADIKSDLGLLRAQILQEYLRQEADLKDFKEETNDRFEKLEKSMLNLQEFKWRLTGGMAILFGAIQILVTLAERYFTH